MPFLPFSHTRELACYIKYTTIERRDQAALCCLPVSFVKDRPTQTELTMGAAAFNPKVNMTSAVVSASIVPASSRWKPFTALSSLFISIVTWPRRDLSESQENKNWPRLYVCVCVRSFFFLFLCFFPFAFSSPHS